LFTTALILLGSGAFATTDPSPTAGSASASSTIHVVIPPYAVIQLENNQKQVVSVKSSEELKKIVKAKSAATMNLQTNADLVVNVQETAEAAKASNPTVTLVYTATPN